MPRITASRYLVTAGWDDVPHLDDETKRELLEGTQPHLRDARSKGIPSIGAGAIYPLPLTDLTIKPFEIPTHWKRAYALDVGWRRTAALWGAWDPTDGVCYAYSEHYMAEKTPVEHVAAIKLRGEWINGVIDPASQGRSQADGRALFDTYSDMGLKLSAADNSVDAGIHKVWTALSLGRIRFFTTLANLQEEFSLYRRDEKGRIVKSNDHLMDCLRYLYMSGKAAASTIPIKREYRSTTPAADERAGY